MTLTAPYQIPIHLPKRPQHYWNSMRQYGERGFTVGDLVGCTNGVTYSTVKGYIYALREMGAVKIIGSRDVIAGQKAHVYAVAIKTTKAPVVRRPDYAGSRGCIQRQCWTAMRTLGPFTLPELAAAASTDECVVPLRTAEAYVRVLMDVGMIVAVVPYKRGGNGRAVGAKPGVYRLLKSKDIGPLPPKVFKASIVFDPNREKIIGVANTSEASS